jgi:hypothetical protein
MTRIAVTVAAGSVVVLSGPGGAPVAGVLVDAPGLVRLVDDGSAMDMDGGEVSWDVGPGEYELVVYGAAPVPRTPARATRIERRVVEDPRAARRAELVVQIVQLRSLVDRIWAYIADLEHELAGLDERVAP